MPNTFAYIVVFAWPVIAFAIWHRKPAAVGVCCAIIGGYLLLPGKVSVDFPVLPAYNKGFAAITAATLLAWFSARRKHPVSRSYDPTLPGLIPQMTLMRTFIAMSIFGTLLTTFLNRDPLTYGATYLPGLSLYDGLSSVLTISLTLVPFLLARKYLGHPDSQRTLISILVISITLYCIPALIEVRLSPQMNRWFYGYFPHSFLQHMRDGGFRPLVFLSHGLALSLLLAMGLMAALAYRTILTDPQKRLFVTLAIALIFGTLILSKSFGALIIGIFFGTVMIIGSQRVRIVTATVFAVVLLTFPALRSFDVIPTGPLLSFAATVDPERAGSLQFRLEHENRLLDKANQKPIAGWGAWGRQRVYDEAGRDISVTDGYWILAYGSGGWLRYIGLLGLISAPVILICFNRRLRTDHLTVSLALILAANMVDLIPNASLTHITWLLAGSLVGRLEWANQHSEVAPAALPEATESTSMFSPSFDNANSGVSKVSQGSIYRPRVGGNAASSARDSRSV